MRSPTVSRDQITSTYELIRPYLRRTPMLESKPPIWSSAAARLPSSWSSCSTRDRSRRVARLPICCRVPCRTREWWRHRAAIMDSPLPMPRTSWGSLRPSSCRTCARRPSRSASGAWLQTWSSPANGTPMHSTRAAASRPNPRHWKFTPSIKSRHCVDKARSDWKWSRPQIDTLLIAVGGGGLLGGVAAWFDGKVKLIAVEPRAAPTLYRALEAGQPVDAEAGGIAADSLAPSQVSAAPMSRGR